MKPKSFGRKILRVTTVVAVVGLSASVGTGAAVADKPVVNPGALPAGGNPAPPDPTEQPANSPCASTSTGGDGPTVPTAQRSLELDKAWQFSRGGGQLVAVIDTGVMRHPRLPGLIAAGDYVSTTDGTDDCDAHGTFVAGIIAATQVPGQGFSGVAPDAQVMSIRQTSGYFQKKGAGRDKGPDAMPDGYGTTHTLAQAVRRAADMGATVINMSEVACQSGPIPDDDLGAAVHYAAVEKNVVVVTAAANNDKCKGTNPVIDPLDPSADPWSKVNLNVSPARWDDYVLSVGSIDDNGQPSKFTVPGPWLGVAAPGENLTSLDPHWDDPRSKGTAVAKLDQQGKAEPVSGTSFAAPYVAGVAALVRARYPELSALEVVKRIEATAHAPAEGWNPYVGYGAVDPVAALTAQVPNALPPKRPGAARSWQLPVPTTPPAPDHTSRNVALIGSGAIGVLVVLGFLASYPLRRRFGDRGDQ
ncbi:type VII secretion-associated serine protease mycosin [Nocardia spumae]|uniref:type VII secretion-associated serine protease mycosin n=1 Tax=Nocardia spumae TaxID=2887190 RepID=UPI001D13CB62|nr:type VII secretion-associated serine protease mycosin [Nocardia spumae]